MNPSLSSGRKGGALALTVSLGLLAGLAPKTAEATNTRVWTLGVMNRYIVDDANRWLWPHMITKFGNLFYIELYGAQDSFGSFAPTSQRSRDSAGDLFGGATAHDVQRFSLTAGDLVAVQATAGGGAILSLTDDLFVSFHLSDFENPLVRNFLEGPLAAVSAGNPNSFGWLGSGRMPETVSDANRKFDVFTAYNIQDVAALGLLLSYGSSKYHYRPNSNDPDILGGDDALARDDDNIGASEFRFLLSGGLELGDSAAVDVGFGMGFHTLTYLPNQRSDDVLDGGNGLELQADIRALFGVSEYWEIIPAISFRNLGMSGADLADYNSGLFYNVTDDSGDAARRNTNITDVKVNVLILDLGVAGHFRPNEIVQFWGAAGFQIQRQVFQYEHTIPESDTFTRDNPVEFFRQGRTPDAFPYLKLALEARVFSWLDFRGGVVKYLRADSTRVEQIDDQDTGNNRDNDFTQDLPFFDYFVGLAAHYEGFFLDMQLDPQWFKRGPEFLSGAQGNMFINGSLGYRY